MTGSMAWSPLPTDHQAAARRPDATLSRVNDRSGVALFDDRRALDSAAGAEIAALVDRDVAIALPRIDRDGAHAARRKVGSGAHTPRKRRRRLAGGNAAQVHELDRFGQAAVPVQVAVAAVKLGDRRCDWVGGVDRQRPLDLVGLADVAHIGGEPHRDRQTARRRGRQGRAGLVFQRSAGRDKCRRGSRCRGAQKATLRILLDAGIE